MSYLANQFKTKDFKFWYKFGFELIMIVWILQRYIFTIIEFYDLLSQIKSLIPTGDSIEELYNYLIENKITNQGILNAFF